MTTSGSEGSDPELAAAQAELDAANRELAWELSKAAVDVAGIADPTPVSDLVGAGMSLFDGDLIGAGLSLISVVPYVGDALGKTAKGARVAKKLAALEQRVAGATRKLASLRKKVASAKSRASRALEKARSAPDRPPSCAVSCGDGFRGTLRGADVSLPGVRTKRITYRKRDPEEAKRLRDAFDSTHRKQFMKDLAGDPEKVEALRRAGLNDADLAKMQKGKVPTGYQVHHKLPLDDGGTNDPSNLVLIKNEPAHKALTNAQSSLTRGMKPGDTRQMDFPVPDGFVYPPQPGLIKGP